MSDLSCKLMNLTLDSSSCQFHYVLLTNNLELPFNRFLQTKTVFTFVLVFACSIEMFNNFEILIQGLN